ncbi:MAG: 6-phospho-beta-glucosidase [Firmicutes bacterium]|nr:6-phospho-beta-glucosidase [Bacillota bacterium]MCL1953255.1 6-phospho-beta-glucosidase [Bacillota bacterium]
MSKKQHIKIATIGGGSSYTPELIEGFILRHKQLPVSEIWLVDIPEGKNKLDIVAKLGQRMIDKAGLDIKIVPTLDRRQTLKNADFVTTQLRVGQIDARILDERIPNSLGLIGQETNGAGGIFKAFRTVPVIFDIVKDMQELCPDAWLLNFTNPSGMITEAITRYTGFKKAIGLCNLPIHTQKKYADLLGVKLDRVRVELQGGNHFVFVTDVFLDGVSIMGRFIDIYLNKKEDTTMKNISGMDFSPALIKGLGAIPCSYHNYYFHTREQLDKQLKDFENNTVRGEVVKKVEEDLFKLYSDPNLNIKPKELELRGGAMYSDAACNLVSSLYNNTGDIQYLDVVNNGTISDLPNDCVIEAACVVTANGPIPLNIGKLKPEIAGLIQQMKSFERMTIKAAKTGDRNTAVSALNLNPLIDSDLLANKVFDELYKVHKRYLPQFDL